MKKQKFDISIYLNSSENINPILFTWRKYHTSPNSAYFYMLGFAHCLMCDLIDQTTISENDVSLLAPDISINDFSLLVTNKSSHPKQFIFKITFENITYVSFIVTSKPIANI